MIRKGYQSTTGLFDPAAWREWRYNLAYLRDAQALEAYEASVAARIVREEPKGELPFDLPKHDPPTYRAPSFIGPLPKPVAKCVCEWDEDCLLVRDADAWNEKRPSFHPHRSRKDNDASETTGPPLTAEEERKSEWYVATWELNDNWTEWDYRGREGREPRKWLDGPRRRAEKVEASCPAPAHYQRFLDPDVPGSMDVLDMFDPERQHEMAEARDDYDAWYASKDVTADRWERESHRYTEQQEFARSVMLRRRDQLIAAIREAGQDPTSPTQAKWVQDVIAKKREWASMHRRTRVKRDEYGHITGYVHSPLPETAPDTTGVVLADGKTVLIRKRIQKPLVRESEDRILTRAYCACLVQLLGTVPPLMLAEDEQAVKILGAFLRFYAEDKPEYSLA